MGNTCEPEGHSKKFTLAELANLPIGQRRQMNKGCGPSIGGLHGGSGYDRLKQRGFGWPQNGEFVWGGLGDSCSMCSDPGNGYGCDNCSGASAIGGSRGTVKRTAFKANPVDCCLGKHRGGIIGQYTCNPKHTNPTSPDCVQALRNHCAVGNRTFVDQQCRTFCSSGANRSWCEQQKQSYCNQPANFGKTECKQWCRMHPGRCDTGALAYCNFTNPKDPICSCIQTEYKKYNPACIDGSCISTGYRTANMDTTRSPCPNIQDCSVVIDIDKVGGDVVWDDVNIVQNCKQQIAAQATVAGKAMPTRSYPEQAGVPAAAPAGPNMMLIFGGIGLFFFLMFIILIIVMFSGGDEYEDEYYEER